jgi:uncharacterized membrane protein (UPF0127 family)
MTAYTLQELAPHTVKFTTWFQQFRGLMFRKKSDAAHLFIFSYEKKIPIHMFFVFYPIDVLWISTSGQIVDLKKNVKPFTPMVYHRGKAQYMVELPAGTLSRHKIALMDTLKI